jgi:hypothetical protein
MALVSIFNVSRVAFCCDSAQGRNRGASVCVREASVCVIEASASSCACCFFMRLCASKYLLEMARCIHLGIRQHTHAYVGIRQHTLAYVGIRDGQRALLDVLLRVHTSRLRPHALVAEGPIH